MAIKWDELTFSDPVYRLENVIILMMDLFLIFFV